MEAGEAQSRPKRLSGNHRRLPLPVLRERAGVRVFPASRRPLTPTLSPEYRGEGAFRVASKQKQFRRAEIPTPRL